jgi:hypothetical protein
MRNQRPAITALLSYGLLFCMSTEAQEVRKIYVNPQNPAIQKQSSFVDSIRFIPFESIKGVSIESSNVKPTENYYIVTDYRSRTLYLYSKSGAFVKAVNYSSLGANLYPLYRPNTNQLVFFGDNSNYTLTSKDRIKILLDWNNKRNLKYFRKYVLDLNDTSFAIRKSSPDNYDLTGASLFDTDHYIQTKISTSELYPDSIGYEVAIYAKGKLINHYFPYNRVNEPRFLFGEQNVSASFSDTPYVAYLARPYCDTIYRLVKDSLSPAYQLVLPLDKSLPASFFSKPFKTKAEKENFQRNNGWVFHQVHNFYETPRLLYFAISFFMRFETFIYDKQTNTAYNVTKIKADPKQYNLPLLASFGFKSGKKYYTLLKADALISFFKQNPDVPVPGELALFLQGNPEKNTPVVVEYSLKN